MEFDRSINLKSLMWKLTVLFILLIFTSLFSLLLGSANINISELFASFSGSSTDTIQEIILHIRIPRLLLAIGVGGGLSVAGAVFQSLLMNPLADPYILGVSSGGSFGAVLALLLGLSFIWVELFSIIGASIVILLVFIIGHRFGKLQPNILLLTGVMIGAFFSALILLLLTFLNDTLRTAIFWLVGNLAMADNFSAYYIVIFSLIISVVLSLFGYKLNLLAMGDEDASNLGLNPKRIKSVIYILASVLVGIIVSVSGIIGFVGLLIPHFVRIIFSSDNRIVVPASFLIGAIFLVFTDTIARTVILPSELPVGVVTAIIGAPVFIYLLKKRET
ncbi:MAG: iron ABC transporter permease [Melioribacteraceae bacterium]|nr:iron ABC transporter permease [Melioribacteraceae bacterium]